MKRQPKKIKKQAAIQATPVKPPGSSRPVFRFAGRFCLWTIVIYGVVLLPGFQNLLNHYLVIAARIASWLLNRIGEATTVADATIFSPKGCTEIVQGCSGLEFVVFACAAIGAFPAPPATWRRKIVGLVMATVVISAINLLRIVCLHWVSLHHESILDLLHTEICPSLFLVMTIMVTLAWVRWVTHLAPLTKTDALA